MIRLYDLRGTDRKCPNERVNLEGFPLYFSGYPRFPSWASSFFHALLFAWRLLLPTLLPPLRLFEPNSLPTSLLLLTHRRCPARGYLFLRFPSVCFCLASSSLYPPPCLPISIFAVSLYTLPCRMSTSFPLPLFPVAGIGATCDDTVACVMKNVSWRSAFATFHDVVLHFTLFHIG